jgi:hypothetical protein
MSLADYSVLALASWTITYHLCFGPLFGWLRERVGIAYTLDDQGRPIDRWGINPLAEFLNCPSCVAIVSTGAVLIMWYNGVGETVRWLAVLGAVTIIARWWVSQRVKAEWWL